VREKTSRQSRRKFDRAGDNHRQVRAHLVQHLCTVESIQLRHADVKEDDVVRLFFCLRERLLDIFREIDVFGKSDPWA
jgi:hypothetical protein